MWEFNLICEPEDSNYLKYVKSNLSNCDLVSIYNNTLTVACKQELKTVVKKQLKYLVAEIVILIYKEKYFKKNLDLNMLSKEYREALIKCLVMFDYEDDLYYVLDVLELEYNLNIESFYIFKLKKLTKKWQEIKNIAKSGGVGVESEALVELIKFLIDSISPKRQTVNIYFNGKTFVLKDENNMIIKLNETITKSNMEINLITTLISLSPKTINLHCISCLTENTFKVLYYIFNKKINLLV